MAVVLEEPAEMLGTTVTEPERESLRTSLEKQLRAIQIARISAQNLSKTTRKRYTLVRPIHVIVVQGLGLRSDNGDHLR